MSMNTVLDAATAIVNSLGVNFGEVTIQVAAGEVVLIRHGTTMKPEDLSLIRLSPQNRP
jgi:hypothetical protein